MDEQTTNTDDGDGYAEVEGDCDDEDPAMSPRATERCDGRDEDCSGFVEGEPDDNGDGVRDCEDADGDSLNGWLRGDGDDTDPSVYPSTDEACRPSSLSAFIARENLDESSANRPA